ncbi:GNAT family N-acetyltransferase, partial [Lutimaribacter sp. EGI FJ00014]|nr:GNAT family N-acetyltransferase [Lutimaribacter sp. EGI FJ00014]
KVGWNGIIALTSIARRRHQMHPSLTREGEVGKLMEPIIEICERPDESDREAILAALDSYNIEVGGPYHYEPVAVLIRESETGQTLGGLWGECLYDWLFIKLLFVPKQLRGRRIGTRLIQTAEQFARVRDCVGIWLDTYEFQAPAFYQSMGYEVFGSLPDHPKGSRRYFLRKMLAGD